MPLWGEKASLDLKPCWLRRGARFQRAAVFEKSRHVGNVFHVSAEHLPEWMPCRRRKARRLRFRLVEALRQDVSHHASRHIGQTEGAAIVGVGELLVVQAQEVQDR